LKYQHLSHLTKLMEKDMAVSPFDPIKLGHLTLKNRILMAPMTRGRADAEGAPQDIVAEYYAQRAEAGLIITEAVAVNPLGHGWPGAPGLYTNHHEAAWAAVATAVHAAGGHMFMQLWHMGGAVIPDHIGGAQPVAPSAVALEGEIPDRQGNPTKFVNPRALTESEIAKIVDDFAESAERAVAAGVDGVEIHAANSFLIDQFLRDSTNRRTDNYGGSVANRARFLLEVVDAVAARIGADRVGVRISPTNAVFGTSDSDPQALYTHVAEALSTRSLAYLHVLEPSNESESFMATQTPTLSRRLRQVYSGTFILNGGLDLDGATAALREERANAVALATPFIANPDLVTRLTEGIPLATPDPATFYTPGPEGYCDYPGAQSAAA
jgi:N-ethylmaleimide reductase